jgi:methylaspartate mutase sigma subunit
MTHHPSLKRVAQKRTIVLGVIGADVHAVANKILDLSISEAGFKVVNLGVMVSQEEFINAAVESDAGAILVSSLYGHGEMDCRGLREKCVEAGIGDTLLYAGGNLVVGKRTFDEVERVFHGMGYNRVYPPGTMPEVAIADLQKDLGL